MMHNKKGFVKELGILPTVVILLVVAALVASLGQQLLGESRADQAESWCDSASHIWVAGTQTCQNSTTGTIAYFTPTAYDYNATVDAQSGINEINSKFDTMGMAVAIVLVLAIIMGAFAYIKMR